MYKFKVGRVHFRNSGMKGIKCRNHDSLASVLSVHGLLRRPCPKLRVNIAWHRKFKLLRGIDTLSGKIKWLCLPLEKRLL